MIKSNLMRRLMIISVFIFLAAPVSYFIRILFARSMTIEEYGVFYAVIAFLGLIAIFKDFGMNSALIHFLPKFIKNKQFKKIKSAISIVFSVEIVTAILLTVIILSMKNFLAESFFQSNIALLILPIFAFLFLFQNIFGLMVSIFRGYRKEIFYASSNPIRLVIVLILSLLAYLFFKQNIIVIFSLIWVSSFIIVILLYLFPLFKTTHEIYKEKFSIDKKTFSTLFNYGVFVMLSAAAGILLGRIDVLMLMYFKGATEVGFYEIALPIASIILITINPITAFLFHNISHLYHSKQFTTIKYILQAIYNTGFFLFLPLGLIFFLFPQEIIIVMFGNKYLPAKIALQILAIGFIFKGFSLINFSITDGIGKVKKKSLIILFGAILNVILNAIFIPSLGMVGAAIATSISFALMFVISIIYLIKKVQFKPAYKNWIKTIINSTLFVLIIYLLKILLNLNIYLETAIVIITAGLIYLTIGFAWKILDYNILKKTFIQAIKKQPEK